MKIIFEYNNQSELDRILANIISIRQKFSDENIEIKMK